MGGDAGLESISEGPWPQLDAALGVPWGSRDNAVVNDSQLLTSTCLDTLGWMGFEGGFTGECRECVPCWLPAGI